MEDAKLERKLRKKARKLGKWAKRHGIDYVTMCVSGPDDVDKRWWTDVTASIGDEHVANAGDFYWEGEL